MMARASQFQSNCMQLAAQLKETRDRWQSTCAHQRQPAARAHGPSRASLRLAGDSRLPADALFHAPEDVI